MAAPGVQNRKVGAEKSRRTGQGGRTRYLRSHTRAPAERETVSHVSASITCSIGERASASALAVAIDRAEGAPARGPALPGPDASVTIDGAGDWDGVRTPEGVFAATARVLAALPEAQVGQPARFAQDGFTGVSFELSFVPPSRPGERAIVRHHVVLVGKKRIFHVLHTGPRGQLSRSADLFSHVVLSLREEV